MVNGYINQGFMSVTLSFLRLCCKTFSLDTSSNVRKASFVPLPRHTFVKTATIALFYFRCMIYPPIGHAVPVSLCVVVPSLVQYQPYIVYILFLTMRYRLSQTVIPCVIRGVSKHAPGRPTDQWRWIKKSATTNNTNRLAESEPRHRRSSISNSLGLVSSKTWLHV